MSGYDESRMQSMYEETEFDYFKRHTEIKGEDAEGTWNLEIKNEMVIAYLKEMGFTAIKVTSWFDTFQKFYRWTATIYKYCESCDNGRDEFDPEWRCPNCRIKR